MDDIALLVRDKYLGDASQVTQEDYTRLEAGEPLAYVIGWVPFLNLRVGLDSRPLIPRPETEWWTESLIAHLHTRFGDTPFRFHDMCAGSGAIGLSVLKAFPFAQVTFSELVPEHCELIRKNIEVNSLHSERADIRQSDLFLNFGDERWDVVAANPPYIPQGRELDMGVTNYEPGIALFSGSDGLDLIRRLAVDVPSRLHSEGELWLECDISNIREAAQLPVGSARTEILTDPYDRPRVVVAYYP
jgi:HemK-like putative methylase